MIDIPIDVKSAAATYDVVKNSWALTLKADKYTVVPWTWKQRKYLIQACCHKGELDSSAFMNGLLHLCLSASAAAKDTSILSYIVLSLLNVPFRQKGISITDAEIILARQLGWYGKHYHDMPASDADALVGALTNQKEIKSKVVPQRLDSAGWHSIVFVPDEKIEQHQISAAPLQADSLVKKLEAMFETIACWGGIEKVDQPEFIETYSDSQFQQKPKAPQKGIQQNGVVGREKFVYASDTATADIAEGKQENVAAKSNGNSTIDSRHLAAISKNNSASQKSEIQEDVTSAVPLFRMNTLKQARTTIASGKSSTTENQQKNGISLKILNRDSEIPMSNNSSSVRPRIRASVNSEVKGDASEITQHMQLNANTDYIHPPIDSQEFNHHTSKRYFEEYPENSQNIRIKKNPEINAEFAESEQKIYMLNSQGRINENGHPANEGRDYFDDSLDGFLSKHKSLISSVKNEQDNKSTLAREEKETPNYESLFSESELEERIAAIIEQSAREAGIDI